MTLNRDFLAKFKSASEERWRERSIRQDLIGLQFRPGTRWIRGLSDEEITRYESTVNAQFPLEFRVFLREMNGTDIPMIDVRGNEGKGSRFGPGFYSYPRDIERICQLIKLVEECRPELKETLLNEGYRLPDDATLIPIFGHRFVVCDQHVVGSVVLSIWDASDAIIYGKNIKEYLEREVLSESAWTCS